MGTEAEKRLGPRATQIYESLLRDIRLGKYRAGQRLPTEKELCKKYDVSRPTLRKAIDHLVAEGHAEKVASTGVYVSGGGAEDRVSTVSFMYVRPGEMLFRLQRMALQRGFLLNVFCQDKTSWAPEAERAFLEAVKSRRHAALLAHCSPLEPRHGDLLALIATRGTRVIHVEHYSMELPEQEYILPDYRRAGHMAAMSLLLSDHWPIRVLGLDKTAPRSRMILEGTVRAISEHREPVEMEDVYMRCPPPGGDFRSRLQDFLRSIPENAGLVCMGPRYGRLVTTEAESLDFNPPSGIRPIGICGPIDPLEDVSFDCLDFNRRTLLEKALNAAVEDRHNPLRTLVEPRWVRAGEYNAQDHEQVETELTDRDPDSHDISFVADAKT
ncbi:MAG: GntR family transcriptional regulator [Planctomycetes bacterium]|nr:GntR family transcriptional regulator [Planctomycetota bacterium]